MNYKVLISNNLSKGIVNKFKREDIGVVYNPEIGKDNSLLLKEICNYDAIAIRSDTKLDSVVLNKAIKLKVIGRAGIGVDNIDLDSASSKGIVVMNTPYGNSITTAEHTISLMMSLARNISQADQSTKLGKWEKSKFMGTELFSEVLGMIGCGNIGSLVAERAIGLKMKVIVYDPFVSEEQLQKIGAKKVELKVALPQNFCKMRTTSNEVPLLLRE